jgi:LuxR family transcriptional regulator, maltose regulon positive regulatory protein
MQRVTKGSRISVSRNGASQNSALGKLGAPRLARVFERDRLFAQLDAYASRPIVWLAGPPGSGKTTLVASYLKVRARPLLWLTLDRADSDPATFFHFVSLAVLAARPRQKIQLPSVTNEDLHDLGGFARRYFRLLVSRIEPPWVLVLDNYQELGTDTPLHQALRETVDELSAPAQMVAISRTLPPPAFARTMANQQLGLIDALALRFTVDEAQSLLNLHGQRQDAEPLHAAVDGWAAGLMLMLAADAAAPAQSLSPGSGSLQLVFDYFAGEVLVQMSAADREALMRIAMLPSSTEAMAVAISASPSAARLLRELFASPPMSFMRCFETFC